MDSSDLDPPSLPSEGEASRASAVIMAGLFGHTVVLAERYELGKEVGRGGLGRVHRALDLRLDRVVALKFPKGASGDPAIVRDLEREAKVLARLQHPNIVAVYDVGKSEQGVYLAMEFIEGRSMAAWLVAEKPGWKAVLEVMRAAGAGLAAAHEAGVVHRDFKPSNVMIDRKGRVCVVDFGLAREVVATGGQDTVSSTDSTKTTAAGTPPYMAPEQFDGEVTAASDQFAFCTALYEAVCGRRPWHGRERGTSSAESDRLSRALRDRGVPRWLRRVVLQGLAKEPSKRFVSMGALCERLVGPARGRFLGIGGAFVVAAALLGPRAFTPDPCDAPSQANRIWTTEARAALAEKSVGSTTDVLAAIDGGVSRWNEMSLRSCLAHEAGEVSPYLFELRRRCLRRLADGFEYALAEVLVGELDTRRGPNAIVEALRVDRCSNDEDLLLFGAETADGTNLEVSDEIDGAIERAYIQLNLGEPEKYRATLEDIYRTHGDRRDSGFAGARVAFQYGTALSDWGEFDEAETVLRTALLRYASDPRAHLFVAGLRSGLAGAISADPNRALEAKHLAEEAFSMYGEERSPLQLPALNAHARASSFLKDVASAEASLRRIDEIIAKPDVSLWRGADRNRAESEVVVAEVRARIGKADVAMRDYSNAIDNLRESGNRPALLAAALNNLSELEAAGDAGPTAAAHAEEAAALKDSVNDRVGAALSLMNAGTIHSRGGRSVDAIDAYERAIAMLPAEATAERTELGFNLGLAHQRVGAHDLARASLLEAQEASRSAGLETTELGFNIAVALLQVEVAQQNYEAARLALATVRSLDRGGVSDYARAEVELATCELERIRQPELARAAALRAAEFVDRAGDPELRSSIDLCRESLAE